MITLKELLSSPHRPVISLFESPMKLNTEFSPDMLSSFGNNTSFTTIIKDKATNKGMFGKYDLYDYTVGKSIINVLVDTSITIMFFEFQMKDDIVVEKRIWQDSTHFGIARKFMFDYILKNYSGLISDDTHTTDGQKYWNKMIKDALNMKYGAFVISKEETIPLFNIDDVNKYFLSSGQGLEFRFLIKSD